MHKRLVILALLLGEPLSGYRLHQVAAAHGELYADLKKPNLYYLLSRMEQEGLVVATVEPGARGPRRERLVYAITDAGRDVFDRLLRHELRAYEPSHLGIESAAVLLDHVPVADGVRLLRERRAAAAAYRERARKSLAEPEPGSAGDHLLLLVEAELTWVDRALDRLTSRLDPGQTSEGGSQAPAPDA